VLLLLHAFATLRFYDSALLLLRTFTTSRCCCFDILLLHALSIAIFFAFAALFVLKKIKKKL